jgi:hypothetical protein
METKSVFECFWLADFQVSWVPDFAPRKFSAQKLDGVAQASPSFFKGLSWRYAQIAHARLARIIERSAYC